MSALRRIILLGCFAAVGVALAIGVGTSNQAPFQRPGCVGGAPAAGASAASADAYGSRGSLARLETGQTLQTAQTPLPSAASPPPPPQTAQPSASQHGPGEPVEQPPSRPTSTPHTPPGFSSSAQVAPPSGEIHLVLRAAEPDRPVRIAPGPHTGQMLVPEPSKRHLEQVYEYLRQQMHPPGSAPQLAPLPPAAQPAAGPAAGSGVSGSGAATAVGPAGTSAAGGLQPRAGAGGIGSAEYPAVAQGVPGNGSAAAGQNEAATLAERGDGKLIIHFPDNDIREVLEMLSEQGNLNILASKSVQGRISASLSGVDISSALDAILKSAGYVARREAGFIFVGTPEDFQALENAHDRLGTRVYRPNYVTAAELQKLIEPLLTEKTGVVGVSTPSEVGIGSDSSTAGGDNYAGSDVVVVRDYEAVLTQIDQMVREIDIRPTMVHIEAMILSVKLDDEDRYGVDFELLRNVATIKFGLGNPAASLANLTFAQGTLKFGFLDSSLGAFLEALETLGDVNVIATPRLMVLNKHRAEIQIGESKGYVSTTITETSSSQSVEFLEVGTLLRLRPFISSDGLVRMEIHPELSDGTVKTESGFTLPEKEVTQVTTNIMVRDGCTVVIGGLMRESLSTTRNQIPLFGNLPVVGAAFRNSRETTERREVIVLITPRIVYEPGTCEEGERVACEFHRRQSHYFDSMNPLNKRRLGERYFRLAQSAWAGGEREKALRFAELAVHYDPLNRAALDLRSAIWLGRSLGDHTLQAEVVSGGGTGGAVTVLDGPELPPWLLGELSGAPPIGPGPSATLHPRDPGQPGRHTDLARPQGFEQP